MNDIIPSPQDDDPLRDAWKRGWLAALQSVRDASDMRSDTKIADIARTLLTNGDNTSPAPLAEQLRESATILIGTLDKAARQFRFYQQQHIAKATLDGDEKARTNEGFAVMCESALLYGPTLLAALDRRDAGWTNAARDVLAERRRHVETEGWTPEHDDAHPPGELSLAAACYALHGAVQAVSALGFEADSVLWPWDDEWWKPTGRRRDLVKAGSLILAEIERMDRALSRETGRIAQDAAIAANLAEADTYRMLVERMEAGK